MNNTPEEALDAFINTEASLPKAIATVMQCYADKYAHSEVVRNHHLKIFMSDLHNFLDENKFSLDILNGKMRLKSLTDLVYDEDYSEDTHQTSLMELPNILSGDSTFNVTVDKVEDVPEPRKDFDCQETILYHSPIDEKDSVPHVAIFLMPDQLEEGYAYIAFQESYCSKDKILPPVSVPYSCLEKLFDK